MNIAVRNIGLMDLRAFRRFADKRPDDERWELRDGIPEMNPTPTNFHQIIANNIQFELTLEARRQGDLWHVCPGTNVVTTMDKPNSPIPDVMVRFGDPLRESYVDDIVLAVEIISPESRSRDLKRKPVLYAAIPSLQHYMVVDTRSALVTSFDRARAFEPVEISNPAQMIKLDALAVALPLTAIYRQTGLIAI